MRGTWLVIFAIVLGAIMIFHFWPIARQGITNAPAGGNSEYRSAVIQLGDQTLQVQVPTSLRTQELGLGGRYTMRETEGMYWDLSTTLQPAFWMKGMRFPLDFIWLDGGKVVEVTTDVQPLSGPDQADPPVLRPAEVVDGVIEVVGGFVNRHDVHVGDAVVVEMR